MTVFAGKWIDLGCIIINEVKQPQKEKKKSDLPHMGILAYNIYIYCVYGHLVTRRKEHMEGFILGEERRRNASITDT